MKTLFLLVFCAISASAQTRIIVPPEVWIHYKSMGTNLAALDSKLYDLKTVYLADVKAAGVERSKGRLDAQEYTAKAKAIQKK